MKNVILWTGAGQIGMAIARRVGYGKKIVAGDKKFANAQAVAKIMNEAGFDVTPVETDISSRESIQDFIAEGQMYGQIEMLINAAGVSPSQAPVEAILKVDLYGTAVLLEEVGKVIVPGGVGVTISSQSGHRCPPSRPRRTSCWQRRRRKNFCHSKCCNPPISAIRCTPIRWQSAATKSASWRNRCGGEKGARASIRSRPASSSRLSR